MTQSLASRSCVIEPGSEPENPGRRALLHGLAACLAGSVACCQRSHELGPECETDPQQTEADIRMRATLEYVDMASDAKKACDVCRQFVPAPQADSCGTCKLVRGPIHPKGTCKVFAPQV
jgi:hypothetical protein